MHADKTSRKTSMNAVENSLARGTGASQLPTVAGEKALSVADLSTRYGIGERYGGTVVSAEKIFWFRLIFFLHASAESVSFIKCACFG